MANSVAQYHIVGTGRVAQALAARLHRRGLKISTILGRNKERGMQLAKEHLSVYAPFKKFGGAPGIYLIAVSDDAIEEVGWKLARVIPETAILAHTSGATSIEVLRPHGRRGIFYPLQSFSGTTPPNWEQIPLLIDGNNEDVRRPLERLARRLVPNVRRTTDAERQHLHLAAVVVNNFTNHLYHLAADYCEQQEVPFELLQPLIRQTAQKISGSHPREAQTGPARRGDEQTLRRHLRMLEDQPELHTLYEQLSRGVRKKYE